MLSRALGHMLRPLRYTYALAGCIKAAGSFYPNQ
jgi:hypothetical protein